MKIASRLAQLFRRHRNARRWGVHFVRAKSFTKMPDAVRFEGRTIALDMPKEEGQLTAFVEILLDDCYRLREVSAIAEISTVLDVGANAGLFSIAARCVFPGASIHA
jgi:hypothetical protein